MQVQIDKEPKIKIVIDNRQDLELFEFANAMSAVNNQYFSFLNADGNKNASGTHKLYIRKLTEGSIIVELCEKAPLLFSIVQPYLGEFYGYITSVLNYLSGRSKDLLYTLGKSDWVDFKKILEPIANIKNSHLTLIKLNINSDVTETYNNLEAAAAQNQADREIKKLEINGVGLIKENVELHLYQARNSNLSKSMQGNMGIIPEIHNKPKVLSFANERIRYDITKAEENPFNFAYNVDVEVKLKNEKLGFADKQNIKGYEILKLRGIMEIEQSDIFEAQVTN
jgi:hypothetical protein